MDERAYMHLIRTPSLEPITCRSNIIYHSIEEVDFLTVCVTGNEQNGTFYRRKHRNSSYL